MARSAEEQRGRAGLQRTREAVQSCAVLKMVRRQRQRSFIQCLCFCVAYVPYVPYEPVQLSVAGILALKALRRRCSGTRVSQCVFR